MAFVGTVLLVVVLGVLGLRLLGQSNERVVTLGTLQERAFAYGKLRSDTEHVRLLLAQNTGGDYYKVWPGSIVVFSRPTQTIESVRTSLPSFWPGCILMKMRSRAPAFSRR